MAPATDLLLLAGRLVLGGYFVSAGLNHFRHLAMLSGYAASKGTPAPRLAVAGTGALLILGGLSVATGILPLVGLALLALFLAGVTPMMHAYWKVEDPMARMGEKVNFAKNLALLGAVLALTAVPRPWPLDIPLPF